MQSPIPEPMPPEPACRHHRHRVRTGVAAVALLLWSTALGSRGQAQDYDWSGSDTPSFDMPGTDGMGDYAEGPGYSPEFVPEYEREVEADRLSGHEELEERAASQLEETEEAVDVGDADTASLPTGEATSAVTPQAISLPSAEGSVEGMGESFSPSLSSGTGTFSVPIALPAGRAGVQPSFSLSYATTGGNGSVGFGWGLSAPFIVRQSDRGVPRYDDNPLWTDAEDRFFYNGGQELVPVDNAVAAASDASDGRYTGTDALPDGVDASWQQYRARIEGGFMRFFRSPNFRRWVVQGKDGTRFEFGELSTGPLDLASTNALIAAGDDGTGRIYGWNLSRMSDAHGSTVYYRYTIDDGQRYLADAYYLSPQSCAASTVVERRDCSAPLSDYGVRVAFEYEGRPDVFASYTSGWRMGRAWRLARVAVSAAEEEVGTRYHVRRYHLSYRPESESFHSLLASVQVEGRVESTAGTGTTARQNFVRTLEGSLGPSPQGALLPPMHFGYTETPTGGEPGFGGLNSTVQSVVGSPSLSVSASEADLFDVNSDGLPDFVVTDPARYRTSDGQPAVGVFFNGFTGSSASPADAAATFSAPVPVPMPPELSASLSLDSSTIVPMDADGDGRSDLLHLPRDDYYGYFAPTRMSDEVIGGSVSPADQGWRFSYRGVELERGTDPRIDLIRFGEQYKMFDVNGDHLVDIVRTSGTALETWLNLGRYPDGNGLPMDGRFGQATFNGTGWDFTTEPYRTCLPHDGLPLDFGDREVRLADMNGDGLQDLVKLRAGRVVYWPNRGANVDGSPVFGVGPTECAPNLAAGDDREVVMVDAPRNLNIELDGVSLSDINGDGAADLVQVRHNAIDVWYNVAGEGWVERTTISAPVNPAFLSRVRYADLDGSGTQDVVYAAANNWQYIDFMGGQRPRLLTTVENGLGGITRLDYESSTVDYLRDLRDTEAGAESFAWSQVDSRCDVLFSDSLESNASTESTGRCVHRSGASPVVSTVVRSMETSDQFDLLGLGENVVRTEYRYHNGYYEGIEQEFRGFGAADATAIGDQYAPTGRTRTYFYQGRRPGDVASNRLADNPREALKGRTYLTEVFDEAGTYLSSAFAALTMRRLMTGQDGTAIWYGYVHQTDTLAYDTAPFEPSNGVADLQTPAVQFEDETGAVFNTDAQAGLAIRGLRHAHTRSVTTTVDNLGQVLEATAYGRIYDSDNPGSVDPSAPVPGAYDEDIVSHSEPMLLSGSAWIWRTDRSWVTGHGTAAQLGYTENTYDPETGDLIHTRQRADHGNAPLYRFAGDGSGGLDMGSTPSTQWVEASSSFDAWGNATATCGGADLSAGGAGSCLRYGAVIYDAAYAQLPETERSALHNRSETYCDAMVDGLCTVETTAQWERGLGAILQSTSPNAETSRVEYDGLGRTVAAFAPTIAGDCVDTPNSLIRYHLNVDGMPVSMVESTTFVSCNGVRDLVGRSYVDGLGRARAALTRGENNASGGGKRWIQSGVVSLNARGAPYRAYDPDELNTSTPALAAVLSSAVPLVTTSWADAFGREVERVDQAGAPWQTRYHALSTEGWDPLDLGMGNVNGASVYYDWSKTNAPGSVYDATPGISRVDGHGRGIDQVLHNRVPSAPGTDEYYRLVTEYRADGAVTRTTRMQTTSAAASDLTPLSGRSTHRDYFYDTLGRRLGATDQDSDSRTNADATTSTWRYLFNQVGDLVAVRDPRGCGQNFFYDWAGRLLAEQYVACGEAQTPHAGRIEQLPGASIAMGVHTGSDFVDVRAYYDEYDASVAGWNLPVRPTNGGYVGRLAASVDRASRTAVGYDERGRPAWTARHVAILDGLVSIPTTLTGNRPTDTADGADNASTLVFDDQADHAYTTIEHYDRADRTTSRDYPIDPDYAGGNAPQITGTQTYDGRGQVEEQAAVAGTTPLPIAHTDYDEYGRVRWQYLRMHDGVLRSHSQVLFYYDHRSQLRRIIARRYGGSAPTGTSTSLGDLDTYYFDNFYRYDAAGNFRSVHQAVTARSEWPSTQRPRRQLAYVDALYRVSQVAFTYQSSDASPSWGTQSTASDWRDTHAQVRHDTVPMNGWGDVDPMQRRPAPMVAALPPARVVSLMYRHDWLANMTEWDDDAHTFYERALGAEGGLENGADLASIVEGGAPRPSALYLATNIDGRGTSSDRGGWLDLQYGEGGNVVAMTVRGQCQDAAPAICADPGVGVGHDARADALAASCDCAIEQHYVYRWDELNRISEARRYDRTTGHGSSPWTLEVRQRYLYDASNVRIVKETRDGQSGSPRAALYPYPGDFERRGLEVDSVSGMQWVPASGGNTETQYVIAGARLVWKYDRTVTGTRGSTEVRGDARFTYAVTDLIQSISLSVDLFTGSVLEASTYYPNGARETWRRNEDVPVGEQYALEPMGFTGKEDDSEVGLVYFGERYLMPHVGRWASPDPLHVHASGGGEFGNSYHYVSGNLLQGRDPLGLEDVAIVVGGGLTGDGAQDIATFNDGVAGSVARGVQSRSAPANVEVLLISPGFGEDDHVEEIISFVQAHLGPEDQLVMYGYSHGGQIVIEAANDLEDAGIDVDMLVTVDAQNALESTDSSIAENVRENVNFYQTNASGVSSSSFPSGATSHVSDSDDGSSMPNGSSGSDSNSSGSGSTNSPGSHGRANRARNREATRVRNVDLSSRRVNHGNIDEETWRQSVELLVDGMSPPTPRVYCVETGRVDRPVLSPLRYDDYY